MTFKCLRKNMWPARTHRAGRTPGLSTPLLLLILVHYFLLAGEDDTVLPATPQNPVIYLVDIKGSINPGTYQLFARALDLAQANGSCLIIELDTPGGLVSTLRQMVQRVMASSVPIVVYVAPSGARAASAGAILTMSANIAAMAPGTNIGAAHPVGLSPDEVKDNVMKKKVENDLAAMARSIAVQRGRNMKWAEDAVRKSVSATADEALRLKVIDLIAENMDDLLSKMDDRMIRLTGKEVLLKTGGARLIWVRENLREKILSAIGDPNIAYILMMIGVAGLYFELANPGTMFPGIIGGISLLLGLYAMQALPVNTVGLALYFLGIVLFIAELFITSHGLLGIGGAISLILGSVMLFDTPATGVKVTAGVLWPTLVTVVLFLGGTVFLAARATLSRPRAGMEALIGAIGTVRRQVDPQDGLVFVHGELWRARSDSPIPPGTKVQIASVKGLILDVKPIDKEKEHTT